MNQCLGEELVDVLLDIFTALIDKEEGYLQTWPSTSDANPAYVDGLISTFKDPLWSGIQMVEDDFTRILLVTERDTAQHLARRMFFMDEADPLSEGELADAYGEIVNILGGNLKALLNESSILTLPTVSREEPDHENSTLLTQMALNWRGRLIVTQLWGSEQFMELVDGSDSEYRKLATLNDSRS